MCFFDMKSAVIDADGELTCFRLVCYEPTVLFFPSKLDFKKTVGKPFDSRTTKGLGFFII